ncbi:uncharacterized protein LOC144127744 [Amblyomma americanum]
MLPTEAPQAFMTDNSAAEKAALQATWPEGKQLLCHFHVAQAEWRWLHASRDTSRDDKRDLMTTFQKDAAEVLKNITEALWRQYSLAADNPFYLTLLQRDLALLKRARTEPQEEDCASEEEEQPNTLVTAE